jgi:hypothetical protein
LFVPVPHVVAQQGLGGELVVQADLGNAVDVAQGLGRSKSGWLSSRRAKVSMICCLLSPVPRGPRTARMKGKPKRAL